ncbi:MAG: precorrin-6y C5,15-methyltransferase (decarboxylating) subunit CbiE [Candidatus Accumulibacter sp.]|jgi:cobalt-precorrin-7 (C5)-methyltransferase|nr:precorrin-6y C5,15-methyltransferase (decarboxylating) subunit CbiE [Accumulibacter sp.]
MNKVYVLGMGPGHPDYVPPLTRRLIAESGALIGGERHLAAHAGSGKVCFPLRGDLSALADLIRRERASRQVAVLVSGDPGFYGLLDFLRRHFPADELRVEPGISAFQYLMAKIGEPWHGAALASLHGRGCDFHALIDRHRRTALLTGGERSAHWLAARLLDRADAARIEMIVGADLSYPEERIARGAPARILEEAPFGMATAAVINHDA